MSPLCRVIDSSRARTFPPAEEGAEKRRSLGHDKPRQPDAPDTWCGNIRPGLMLTISTSFGCGVRFHVRGRRRNDCPGFVCVHRHLVASLGSACLRFDPASLSLEMPLLDSFAWVW